MGDVLECPWSEYIEEFVAAIWCNRSQVRFTCKPLKCEGQVHNVIRWKQKAVIISEPVHKMPFSSKQYNISEDVDEKSGEEVEIQEEISLQRRLTLTRGIALLFGGVVGKSVLEVVSSFELI